MLIRLYAIDDRADLAFRADHKGRPINPHIFPAIHALFLEHIELLDHSLVYICQKRVRQIIFLFEFLLCRRLIGRNAEHNSAGTLDLLECVAEPARLQRSTGSIGFGVKEQDHVLAAIVLQGYRLAFFIRQRELGGFIINLHGFSVLITSMNLYSRRKLLASLGSVILCLLALAFTAATVNAQRRSAHKLRATAVLEVTTDPAGIVSTRVIPVTVLDEGRFQDASTYRAAPRPMALDNGIVYEAQKSGIAAGFVTIVNSVNNGGWTALGKWQPITTAKKTETAPAPVNVDDRPILHHGDAGNATSAPTPAPSATPTPEQEQPSSSPPQNDSERPVLRHRASSSDKPEQQASPSPTPAAPQPAEGTVPKKPLPVIPAGTRTFVGISDNQSLDSRSFDFLWKPGEEQQMEPKMRKLLLAQLPRENAQLQPSSLKNVVMRSFDLDLSNDAVIVMSAELPGSYLASNAKDAPGKFISRYVTVIARVDFEGVPQKLAASVTDSSRLDVAPRLELIDAVDVDGDGLAELLFREYSFDEKSFIIYGVSRNSVTKVFEGASMSLK
jgi:hypothetical protein